MSRKLALFATAATAAVAAIGGTAMFLAPTGASTTAPTPAAELRPVVVEVVRFAPRTPERSFAGIVRPRVESDLAFRVAGKVAERLVQQGDRVVAGQPLLRLDAVDFELSREQAEAEFRAATVNLDQSLAQERRTLELRRNGWTTDQIVERTQAQTAEARARLDRAQRQRELAANQLSYALLTADADGVVTATLAEPGQVVAAGTPVVRLARSGEREAVVAIPEMLVERVREGTATVSLWSRPDRRYDARLREFAAAADPATRTFQARFTIRDADEAVGIGMTATVTIAEAGGVAIARLPISALFDEGQGPKVWVVEASGALSPTPITVAGYDGRDVLIGAGLSEGARVVALGVQKLDAGQRVRIVETRS
jgi:RND family efflux transporter MFP subunit